MNSTDKNQSLPVYGGDMSKALRNKARNKRLMIAVPIILVLLAGGTYYFFYSSKHKAEVAIQTQKKVSKVAQENLIRGNNTQAAQTMLDYINSGIDDDKKYTAMIQLASVYINDEKYDEALKWYHAADKLKGEQTYLTVLGRAHLYEKQGNKQQAAKYFQQMVELTRQGKVKGAFPGDLQYYQRKVKALEAAS